MRTAPSSLLRARLRFLLLPFRRFVYAHIPRRGEGRGWRWGGLPALVGIVLAVVSVILVLEVVFAFAFVSAGRRRSRETGGGVEGVCWCVYAVFAVLVVLADLGELTGYSHWPLPFPSAAVLDFLAFGVVFVGVSHDHSAC